jgi:hypothetical protein
MEQAFFVGPATTDEVVDGAVIITTPLNPAAMQGFSFKQRTRLVEPGLCHKKEYK